MRQIGIMGGTFNPIHIGHLMLAEWASDMIGLDEVWFIPTGISYMKDYRESIPGTERLHMTKLAIKDNAAFKCLDIEVKREGYTYSCETLEQLKGMYPENTFYFIAGADCLFSIDKWKNTDIIFACCNLAAAVRADVTLQEMEEAKRKLELKYGGNGCQTTDHGQIILLPFVNMSVSSTEIRQRIREGRSIRYLVPDSVISYIEEKGFYREERK